MKMQREQLAHTVTESFVYHVFSGGQRSEVRGQLQVDTHKTFPHLKDIPAAPL